MRANKNFFANLWKYYFLLVCLGYYVSEVCLSCLLNTIVNQHNPCALMIMPFFMLLAIFFPKTIILANSHFSNYSVCPKQEPRFIFETKLLLKLSIYKIMWTYKVGWSHYFTNLYFVGVYKRISITFKKTF
jgi:hypothetical protein